MKAVLAAFRPTVMRNAIGESFKISHLPGQANIQVPQEAAYQSELERVFLSWLPNWVSCTPQFNAGGRRRCDIVITPSIFHRLLLEIVASEPIANIQEHFLYALHGLSLQNLKVNSRAKEYGQYLQAKEIWVVHFTLKGEDTAFQYPYPDLASGVNVLHVWHNFQFTAMSIKYKDETGQVITEDIPLIGSQ